MLHRCHTLLTFYAADVHGLPRLRSASVFIEQLFVALTLHSTVGDQRPCPSSGCSLSNVDRQSRLQRRRLHYIPTRTLNVPNFDLVSIVGLYDSRYERTQTI